MTSSAISTRTRIFYFSCVGFIAACAHFLVVFVVVKWVLPKPLIANLMAFCVGINVSYFGHRYLTFRQLGDNTTLQFRRFVMVASTAAVLNETLYYLFLRFTSLHYLVSLVLVIGLVSVFTFIVSRRWACR